MHSMQNISKTFCLLVLWSYGIVCTEISSLFNKKCHLYSFNWTVNAGNAFASFVGLNGLDPYLTAFLPLVYWPASLFDLEPEVARLCKANTVAVTSRGSLKLSEKNFMMLSTEWGHFRGVAYTCSRWLSCASCWDYGLYWSTIVIGLWTKNVPRASSIL